MGFADSVRAWTEKVLDQANDNTCKAILAVDSLVIDKSPEPPGKAGWSTGHLKDSWFPASGGGRSSETTSSAEPSGGGSYARLKAIIAEDLFYGRDNVISFTNNTEYAYRVEKLGWPAGQGGGEYGKWKGATPYQMVALSVQETLLKYKA